jgi:hypothetical protein
MQVIFKNRETLTGVVTVYTTPVDVSNMPLLTATLIVYAISGTTPFLAVQLQTSEDLETWDDVGGSFNLGVAGADKRAFLADTAVYGRYIRAQLALTGTNPLVNFSLYMNMFPST